MPKISKYFSLHTDWTECLEMVDSAWIKVQTFGADLSGLGLYWPRTKGH